MALSNGIACTYLTEKEGNTRKRARQHQASALRKHMWTEIAAYRREKKRKSHDWKSRRNLILESNILYIHVVEAHNDNMQELASKVSKKSSTAENSAETYHFFIKMKKNKETPCLVHGTIPSLPFNPRHGAVCSAQRWFFVQYHT
jgi:hypothetical protein